MKVIITNRCRHVCTSLASIISKDPDIEVTGKFTTSKDLLESLDRSFPDVLILDIGISGTDGFDLIRLFKRRYTDLRILVIAEYTHPFTICWMIKNGAKGYLPLTADDNEILQAVKSVSDRFYYSDIAPKTLFEDISQGLKVHKVVGRQKQILKYMSLGFSDYEISLKLSLSRGTVKYYCERIYKKLGVEDRTENRRMLITFAIQTGLVRVT